MKELSFTHTLNQALYDKAMLKYGKMVETETGRKFFTHLVKAFIQSGTIRKVEDTESVSGLVVCDLTKSKLVTEKSQKEFHAVYKAKIATFGKLEGESDEAFEERRDAYLEAFKSSNPYAVNADFAYTADKTDKFLCMEAVNALTDKYNEVLKDKETYPELVKMIEPRVKRTKKQKKGAKRDKNEPRIYSTNRGGGTGNTLGDVPGFAALKAAFSNK